jgi:hypothetical protein
MTLSSKSSPVVASPGVPPILNLAAATLQMLGLAPKPPSSNSDRGPVAVNVRPQTPSSLSGNRGAPTGGAPPGKRVITTTAAKDPDADFELDSDDTDENQASKNNKSEDLAASDDGAKQKQDALQGGLRGPGGQAVVIPTKVGRLTPQPAATSTTPTTVAAAAPAAAGRATPSTGSTPAGAATSLTVPTTTQAAPVASPATASPAVAVGGGFKGRALVVGGKGAGSSDDSDDED